MSNFYNKKTALVPAAFLLTAIVFFLQSSDISKPVTKEAANNDSWPAQRELRRAAWQSQKLLIVYATGDAEESRELKDFAAQISERFRRIQPEVKAESEITREELITQPLVILGTAFQNEHLQTLISALPFHFGKEQFVIEDFLESSAQDVCLLANYPNPLNRQIPVSILTANKSGALLDFLSGFNPRLFRGSEFRIFRENKTVFIGFFKGSKGEPWEIDGDKSINYLSLSETTLESEHYKFQFVGKSKPVIPLEAVAEKQDVRIKALLNKLGSTGTEFTNLPKINYFIYETAEDKGLKTGNTDLSHFDAAKWEVHAILNDYLNGIDFFADTKLLVSNIFGKNRNAVLTNGLGIYFSVNWMKLGYRHWVKTIYDADAVNPLTDLFDLKICSRESYLFMLALAGSFTDFLIHKYDWPKFLALHQSWPESGFPAELNEYGIDKLQNEWLAFIETGYQKSGATPQKSETGHPVFQRGFCYAHEGYRIYDGYLSTRGQQSLAKLQSLGTNWISITPFGYLDDRNKPGYLHYSFGAGAENDESLVTAAYQAKQLGMSVMLKPHVLMNSRDWGWPGDIKMQSEAGWQQFFKYYKSWIRHYALLAEIYEFDMFCIGVEFMHATTKAYQDEWRDIIRTVRGLYSGPVTYAANWYLEFEQIEFWDKLDYIGLNLYYPLSQKDSLATLDELKTQMAEGMQVIERVVAKYNKPLILTEVGFASRRAAWHEPHVRGDGPPYGNDQAVSYRAIFESFRDKDWFYGFYWWKWPTDLEDGGTDHSGFTPNGKPAEEIVSEWYGRDWEENK